MALKGKKEKEEGKGVSGFLKKIGVTEEVPEPNETTKQTSEQENPSSDATSPSEKVIVVDERSKQILLEAIAQKGPILKQFKELLVSFADIIDDEGKRYIAAMRALEKQGLTLADVEQGVAEQMGALKEEKEKFSQTLAEQEQNLSQRQKDVEKLASQIQEYQKKIKDLENQKLAMTQKVASDRQKLDKNKAGFEAAAQEVEAIINEQGQKIKRLKGGMR